MQDVKKETYIVHKEINEQKNNCREYGEKEKGYKDGMKRMDVDLGVAWKQERLHW